MSFNFHTSCSKRIRKRFISSVFSGVPLLSRENKSFVFFHRQALVSFAQTKRDVVPILHASLLSRPRKHSIFTLIISPRINDSGAFPFRRRRRYSENVPTTTALKISAPSVQRVWRPGQCRSFSPRRERDRAEPPDSNFENTISRGVIVMPPPRDRRLLF